ncbi:hypothetical protein [Clostridium sp. DL-VIII]|uniref:hypothetical protein n=1 Tax=Clostridium sp. DL-VIII TaxID=641107 RepID=UPI0002FA6015|nr:hypothetical protein [Clostridium sp. DL-VIII]
MFQLMNYGGESSINSKNIKISSFEKPQSLDEFSINIIDLSSEEIWENSNNNYNTIDCITDFENLRKMIQNSEKTKIVVILPQDLRFIIRDYGVFGNGSSSYIELKNMLDELVKNILYELLGFEICRVIYENTRTDINGKEIESAFYFFSTYDVVTKSKASSKTTSIMYKGMTDNDILLTTLNLKTYEEMIDLFKIAKFVEDTSDVPQWISDLEMFDDVQQKEVIEANTIAIEECKVKIENAKKSMKKNNEYKSVLHTNSDGLVKVVFEMLEQLIDCDLSDFKDEKKEDFLIKKDDITFIGEIKGVTSNVKYEHVSQLDVHLHHYKDTLEEQNINENVKALLIMNHQRNYEYKDRQPINKDQIALAIRNGSLIIDTYTLLKLFEMFKNHEITSDECIDLFKDRTGLLEI